MSLPGVPPGQTSVSPYLIVKDAAAVIDFLQKTFDGQATTCARRPDGTIMHAQVNIGDSTVMLGESTDQWRALSAMIHVYVADVDATYQKAVAAGAKTLMPPSDQFYGDRSAGVQDACGITWWIATHVRDVSEEEMAQHMQKTQPPQ